MRTDGVYCNHEQPNSNYRCTKASGHGGMHGALIADGWTKGGPA